MVEVSKMSRIARLLANNSVMPSVGIGTWKSTAKDVGKAVQYAIGEGYRHIDCAYIYKNEQEIGRVFKSAIGSVCKRKEMFLVSKLWNAKHEPEDVMPACKKSLSDLQLDYLDLYLMHWPIPFQRGDADIPLNEDGSIKFSYVPLTETWSAMEELVNSGLVKNIGLCNVNQKQISDILSTCRIPPAVVQAECHPYLTQTDLRKFCKEQNIVVTAICPLGSPDRPWAKPGEPSLLDDPKLMAIAQKYNKSPAQVLIRFQIELDNVVIPMSVNPSEIRENIDVFDFSLEEDDIATLKGFNRNWRSCIPRHVINGEEVLRDKGHPFYPFEE